jgi:large subunit ribosomal protein L32
MRWANEAISRPNVRPCPKCGAYVMPHRVCPECNHYKGELIIEQKAKVAEA